MNCDFRRSHFVSVAKIAFILTWSVSVTINIFFLYQSIKRIIKVRLSLFGMERVNL